MQSRYYTNESIRARNIDVTTDGRVVTLRGTVPDEAARQQALNLARSVEGVQRVEDQLTLGAETTTAASRPVDKPQEATGTSGSGPATIDPARVATQIHAQYFLSPEVKPWNVDVTATSAGVVTLSGEVENKADKDEAVRLARETEGVTKVVDHLRLEGEKAPEDGAAAAEHGPNQPDSWITAKVQAKYFLDDQRGLSTSRPATASSR